MIALTLGDRPRLQKNDALAKIIILIQNVDHHLSCFIRGSRVVPRVLLFVQWDTGQLATSLSSSSSLVNNFRGI